MILKILSWVRFLIALGILYAFFYEYLYKKYTPLVKEFDIFYRRNKPFSIQELQKIFDLEFTQIDGQAFSGSQKPKQMFSHVGQFSKFQDQQYEQDKNNLKLARLPQSVHDLIQKVPFNKKVDSYFFDFYNWYRIQFTFTDLGHDSYMEFRITEQSKGSHQMIERISFKLPQNFYTQNPQDQNNQFSLYFNASGIKINISQFSTLPHYNDLESDGLEEETFFSLSKNKTQITELDFQKFGSGKTLTQFNLTLVRKDYEVHANLTHVIRHNQCLTNYQHKVLRHKCMGGYAKGKLNYFYFVHKDVDNKNQKYNGDWQRQSFNLDNTRARTTFIGERSVGNYLGQYLPIIDIQKKTISKKPQWNYKSIQMDFIGFNKLEYYAKKDKIQKQRWVAMTLYQILEAENKPVYETKHQNYLFVNGNIHPIYQIDFELPLTRKQLKNGKLLKFSNDITENKVDRQTPSFQIEFLIQNSTLTEEESFMNNKQSYRIDGYWSGWIDEGTLFGQEKRKHYNQTQEFGYVGFYNITGTIKITQQLK